MKDKNTPEPWDEMTAVLVQAGDPCVLLAGLPPILDCRVLAEPHFQHAKKCVDAHEDMKTLLRECWHYGVMDSQFPQETLDSIQKILESLDGEDA